MKKYLLLSAAATMMCSFGGFAQEIPVFEGAGGTMVRLLPDGVKANIEHNEHYYGDKSMMVAGSPEKGYKAFFAADDGVHGEELWVTDGTIEGTKMVKDINPGAAPSNVTRITRFNDKVVFSADDGENGSEPWISDGTEEGTYMISDVHMIGDSNPRGFCQLDENRFVFFAMDIESESMKDGGEKWLYISDGTEDGTYLVTDKVDCDADGREASLSDQPNTIRVGRKVFFIGDHADKSGPTVGDELWVTDGTADGTFLLKDINLEDNPNGAEGSTNGAAIAGLVNFYNEKLFFKAWSIEAGNEPWVSDGTPEGTHMIGEFCTLKNDKGVGRDGGIFRPVIYKNFICSRADDGIHGVDFGAINMDTYEMKIYDLSTATQGSSSWPDPGCWFDDVYLFCANTGTDANLQDPPQYGGELICFDGEKCYLQYDYNPGTGSAWVREPVVAGGSYYYIQSGGRNGHTFDLNRVDDIKESPVRVSAIHESNDQAWCIRNLGGDIVFYSNTNGAIYSYRYTSPKANLTLNPDNMEPEYRTRAEMEENGVDSVIAGAESDGPAEYYNLQGIRTDANTPGMYIRRQGDKSAKVIIK